LLQQSRREPPCAGFGVALLAILQNGLVLLGVSSYWNQWFVGLTILCAVSITAWRDRRRRSAKAIT
jgi:simple sugar transport system permease protein